MACPAVLQGAGAILHYQPVVQLAINRCRDWFGPPRQVVVAPGRVNLIGEHVDYNEGLVLPVAIDRYTAMAGTLMPDLPDPVALIGTARDDQVHRLSLTIPVQPGVSGWPAYIEGVIAGFQTRVGPLPSLAVAIESTVPPGAGLASSAALTVAMATLLESLLGMVLDPMDKALLCQRAEHQFAGVMCGIMDPISSVFGKQGHAILLDCQSREMQWVPLAPGITDHDASRNVCLMVANTRVCHDLADGQYQRCRQHCAEVAKVLGVRSLREATLPALDAIRKRLDPFLWRRARHVIREIERVRQAVDCMRQTDWVGMGRLLNASHESLRDDFAVSCDELDMMVEIAGRIGVTGGVYGSRMTGGGFGGCTLLLVDQMRANEIELNLRREYRERTGIDPAIFICEAADGCQRVPNGPGEPGMRTNGNSKNSKQA